VCLETGQEVEGKHGARARALEQRGSVGAERIVTPEGNQRVERCTEGIEGEGRPGIGRRELLIHEGAGQCAEPCTAERFGQLQTREAEVAVKMLDMRGDRAGALELTVAWAQVIVREGARGLLNQSELLRELEVDGASPR